MKIYLASTTSGMKKEQRKKAINLYKPLYMLETFFKKSSTCAMVQHDVGVDNFLLDSGAFSFMNGKPTTLVEIEEYVEAYIAHINEYKVKHYFEMDVDSIFGYEQVKIWRKKIESSTGVQSIPVWHKTRGVDDFKRTISEYNYIAIGGFANKELKQAEYPLVKKMVEYARLKGVKAHGLGFTNFKYLFDFPFYSVDSSCWSISPARGGNLHRFKDGKITIKSLKGENKLRLSDMVFYSFGEWVKFQKYMDRR